MPTISFGINIPIAFHKTSPKELRPRFSRSETARQSENQTCHAQVGPFCLVGAAHLVIEQNKSVQHVDG